MITTHHVLINLLAAFLLATSTLSGQSYPYTIDRYDIEFELREDGSAHVREKLDCFFNESRRGIIREIPLVTHNYEKEKRLEINDVHISQENFKISRKSKYLSIKIGDPDKRFTGRKKYIIEYTISDVRQWTGEDYVFYHNLIGTQWSTDIKSGLITVKLPHNLNVNKDNITLYSGKKNSPQSILNYTYADNLIKINVDTILSPGNGVTLGFNYPEHFYDPPPPPDPWYLRQKWAAIPGALLLLLYGLWLKMGALSRTQTEEIRDQPPAEYGPAELGAFIDSKAQYRDFLALIATWGALGYLRIQHGEEDVFLVRLDDIADTDPEYSKTFFNGLFQEKDHVALSELNLKMWFSTARAQEELKEYMLNQKLYDLKSYRLFHSGFTIALVLVLCGGIVVSLIYSQYIASILCGLLVILLLIQFNRIPALTSKGDKLMRHALAYKNYIESLLGGTESGEDFNVDEMLPYMLIYDIDDTEIPQGFRNKLNGPKWFVDDKGEPFSYDDYRGHWRDTQIKSIISTAPRRPSRSSSSGSTFSGGSTGGGTGGGGGSSW